ncbi:hypothetical protein CDEST_05164 [Colletotrichum destructivum]|uniref:Secreted protein n=1 Tax=Colletotrichum destructivum TaxID=34406 RepID=A0AAX4IA09_9PEZI|nr:hypothetical protein CDEST_05164 [Colletotrichum destructivum]
MAFSVNAVLAPGADGICGSSTVSTFGVIPPSVRSGSVAVESLVDDSAVRFSCPLCGVAAATSVDSPEIVPLLFSCFSGTVSPIAIGSDCPSVSFLFGSVSGLRSTSPSSSTLSPKTSSAILMSLTVRDLGMVGCDVTGPIEACASAELFPETTLASSSSTSLLSSCLNVRLSSARSSTANPLETGVHCSSSSLCCTDWSVSCTGSGVAMESLLVVGVALLRSSISSPPTSLYDGAMFLASAQLEMLWPM